MILKAIHDKQNGRVRKSQPEMDTSKGTKSFERYKPAALRNCWSRTTGIVRQLGYELNPKRTSERALAARCAVQRSAGSGSRSPSMTSVTLGLF